MHPIAPQSMALALGVGALITVACRRFRIPPLLPLLIAGVAFGQSGAGLVDADTLGEGLKAFITVSIGLLIFEGALHLGRHELARAPRAVWGLLTIGAVVTWGLSAWLSHALLGLHWPVALLLGAALIVTGPTVVQPLLRMVRIAPRIHTALSAEAILIDPIGVIAVISTLELIRLFVFAGLSTDLAGEGVLLFVKPLLGGAIVGAVCGGLGYALMARRGLDPNRQSSNLNLIAVGVSMTSVGLGELVAPEGGLVAVTVTGICMAQARVLGATELRSFKELLATILVGTLFMLLASRFDVKQVAELTWREALFVALLIALVRPACVLASTFASRLTWRERAFAALFAPRGIVALAVGTVAATEMQALASSAGTNYETLAALARDADRLEPIMFLCIAGTVLVSTLLAPLVGWALDLRGGRLNGVVIIGANPLGLAFARALGELGISARLIDQNAARVAEAAAGGIDAQQGDATDTRWLDDVGSPEDAGWVIAWTGNPAVDLAAARWGEERFGPGRAAIWSDAAVPPERARFEIGGNLLLSDALDAVESGKRVLSSATDAAALAHPLAYIDGENVRLILPGSASPKPNARALYVGLNSAADQRAQMPETKPIDETNDPSAPPMHRRA